MGTNYTAKPREDGKLYWEDVWEGMERCLKNNSIHAFRSYGAIQKRLWGKQKVHIPYWKQKCEEAGIPKKYFVDKLIGKPLNYETVKNVKVTADSFRFAWYANKLHELLPQGKQVALEVGGGYGGLAEHLFRRSPEIEYHIIDAPVMIKLQKYYLDKMGVLDKCHFYPHTKADYDLPKMDLIISMNSLAEMPKETVQKYLDLFTKVIVPETGLLFLVQRKEVRPASTHLHTSWEDYKFDSGWKLEYHDDWISLDPWWKVCLGTYHV